MSWPDPTPRPYWIMEGYPLPHQFILPELKTASMRQRFRAASYHVERWQYELEWEFEAQHSVNYGDFQVGPPFSDIYESVYVLAYGAVTALRGPGLTGNAIAAGLATFDPPGKVFNIGPTDMKATIAALYNMEDIELRGVAPLHWDAKGFPKCDVDIFCIKADFTGAVWAGQTWDPTAGHWVSGASTFDCPGL